MDKGQREITLVAQLSKISDFWSVLFLCLIRSKLSIVILGYPVPKYRWKKIGSNEVFSQQGATLTIDSARLSHNGQYACTPFNVVGDGGTSTIIVEVQGMD